MATDEYHKPQMDVSSNLGVTIATDFTMSELLESIDSTNGAQDLKECLDTRIYGKLVDRLLTDEIERGQTIVLKIVGNELYANNMLLLKLQNTIDESKLLLIKEEIKQIIGLNQVKEFLIALEAQVKYESMQQDRKKISISRHMIFNGNPGTGKTTMARLVGKYLKALGCLSSGHMIETTRNDFVGQYVGETAIKTAEVIKRAIGGVLFIDEAYSLARGKNDSYGVEAVDTIVKYMEDYRDDLVVIMAGYTYEMSEFLKTNSGLKSRFNYIIEFDDYDSGELVDITINIAKSKGFAIDVICLEPLKKYYDFQKKRTTNESGNGRLARNTVEEAIVRHSQLVYKGKKYAKVQNILDLEDFALEEYFKTGNIDELELNSVKKDIDSIIGLEKIKEFLETLETQIRFEKKRNLESDISISRHMLFLGNPGTGKTTVARLVGKQLKALGCLTKGNMIEVSRGELVGQYVGETAQKTKGIIEQALGGVLFIDEAYSLARGKEDKFGIECVDTLIKCMEDYRDDLVVIMAGYSTEMQEFLKVNSGFKSRINYVLDFEDYSSEELLLIAKRIAESKFYNISSSCETTLIEYFSEQKKKGENENGNGRLSRNIVEQAILRHSKRLMSYDDEAYLKEKNILSIEDFDLIDMIEAEDFDLESALNDVVGMENIKEYLRGLYSFIKLNQTRKSMGLKVDNTQTFHLMFRGNPGTGKTMMARIVGKMFYNLGILDEEKLIETDRSGLVAGYVGQTAIKTKQVLDSAKNGVLFIDEAYSLVSNSENDYGKEAVETLLKYIDDNRDKIVVILAGYTNEMNQFLSLNPGLASRFPNRIDFPDYNVEELLTISEFIINEKGFVFSKDAYQQLAVIFEKAVLKEDFGNGRYVRNICEQAIRNMSIRVNTLKDYTPELLSTIIYEDIRETD